MRQLLFTLMFLLVLNSHAQQTGSYSELQAKVQLMKEKYTGRKTPSDQAITVVLQKLCDDYQGRLTPQQHRLLTAELTAMKTQTTDKRQQQLIEQALQSLRSKSDTLDIEQRILDYYARVPQEQLYLHTDKPYYVPGDTVWFRAHLVDGVTHTPISRSRYVYVELLDHQADTLVQRIIVRCDSDGVFANNITLPRHLQVGDYTLAAYTQWMRNFSATDFFYKTIRVTGHPIEGNDLFQVREQPVPSKGTTRSLVGDNPLQARERQGRLLIQYATDDYAPLSCILYGSGNLMVTDYTPGKVLRIDSHSLRPGSISIAMIQRETGEIIAENQIRIEGTAPQVSITGEAHTQNEPIDLHIDLADSDGTPLYGHFSLSVTDYDVVKPDTLQSAIDQYLRDHESAYPLSDMLHSKYPRIDYSFQTSQTISGTIRGTIFKKVKHPQLMLVRPSTGFRETFELGDSSRFTINGLDFADGTSYVLEAMRRSGSTSLIQLDIDPVIYPTLHPTYNLHRSSFTIPEGFAKQAQEQVMYGSVDREIELPEVVKEKKRHHKPTNLMGVPPFRAFYDDDPMLNNFHSMEILLSTLGIPVYHDAEGELRIRYRPGSITTSKRSPVIFIDEFRSNVEELLMLQPATIESIEWFDHVGAANMTIYGWNVSTSGLLLVRQKPGLHGKIFRPLSMATVQQQGWKPNVEFYSPQYTDPSAKTRPDHRTTLYWTPKLTTDSDGHATVRFYASDISKRYLVTLEGVSDDGIIVRKQTIIE
ncbi:MAG: hypothetical protein IJV17_07145 [Prevotella sp.]|nr:hypothetical protein [Prevotella sp.]